MMIPHYLCLLLVSLLYLYPAVGTEEGEVGTCNEADGGGTCASDDRRCFPDGACFDTLEEAHRHYWPRGTTKVSSIAMDVPRQFGTAQEFGQNSATEILEVLATTHDYMDGLFRNETAESFRDECHLRHKLCAYWAAIGECEANPPYMLLQCAPACQTCHQLSFEHRCPYDKDGPKAWGPGDLDKMFTRLTTEDYYVERFEPTVLSSPPNGPWVITLENVASEEQCKHLIRLGADRGYERSADVGEKNFDGTFDSLVSSARTSYNTWCLEECFQDETNQEILRSVENVTGIPDANSEYWQLLQYEENQFYRNHHDFVPFHLERAQGARILTVFLYLNDVEEGGGTHFSRLGITVTPKTGRAVVWPSVLDSDPDLPDPRTYHEALPVKKGIKYGANAWVHQRSFKEPYENNCS